MLNGFVGRTFIRWFPRVVYGVFAVALCSWAYTGARCWQAVIDKPPGEKGKKAEDDVNWEAITPTSERVLVGLCRIHIEVQKCLQDSKVTDRGWFRTQLITEKSQLRKLNIAMVDDEVERRQLLDLRRQQLRLYMGFCLAAGKDPSGNAPGVKPDAPLASIVQGEPEAKAFVEKLRAFAEGAAILRDDIKDERVAELLFGAGSFSGAGSQTDSQVPTPAGTSGGSKDEN